MPHSLNQEAIKASAAELRRQLNIFFDKNEYVRLLANSLDPWIILAENGEIITPIESNKISGGYLFSEQGLSEFNELEEAFAKFKILVTGRSELVSKLAMKISKTGRSDSRLKS